MKTIFITGISRGLGLELTSFLLRNDDYEIYGISRSLSAPLKSLLEKYEGRLNWKQFDVTNLSDIEEEIFNKFIGTDKAIDVFIDNAAILYKDLIIRINSDKMVAMLQTNLIAPIMLSKYVLKNFLRFRTKGCMVHYSSICAHKGFNGLSMIGATKGGVEAFSRTLSREYGRYGIRSNVVVIGILDIGMSFTVNEEQRSEIREMANLKSTTNEQSVIQMTRFLISDAADSITGKELFVDAGIQ